MQAGPFFLVLLLLGSPFAVCGQESSQPTLTKAQELEGRLGELEKRLEALSSLMVTLSSQQPPQITYPDCSQGGFGVVATGTSQFQLLVSCKDVKPFLEGHKISLAIGNPYAADFGGVEVTVYFGKDVEEAFSKHRVVRVPLNGKLKAGSWTRIEVALNPSKVEDLRLLAVSINVDEAILLEPSPK